MAQDNRQGLKELIDARQRGRALYLTIFVFSFFVNVLMLTGPLYMLQIYDRVLDSRSEETLLALSVLVLLLFVAMGFLDHARNRVIARVGARFQDAVDRRVFQASVRRLTIAPNGINAQVAQQDVEAVQRFYSSPVHLALFDIPWTPLFLGAIFIFHPVLGWLSVFGGICLISIALFNRKVIDKPLLQANLANSHAERLDEDLKSETVQALGMVQTGLRGARHWQRPFKPLIWVELLRLLPERFDCFCNRLCSGLVPFWFYGVSWARAR